MNLLPLIGLYMLMRKGGVKWPSPRHPPPRRPMHPEEHHAHAAVHHAHQADKHHAAAHRHEATAEHHVHQSVHHADVSPAEEVRPSHVLHHHEAHTYAAPGTPLEVLHAAPPEPAPATTSDVIPAVPVGYSIKSLQSILVGLGWRGHLTTQGPVQPALRDGLYGPVTHDDWIQSANKRGLDPHFERTSGTTAQVDPETYNALASIARSRGAVVGIGRARMRIP